MSAAIKAAALRNKSINNVMPICENCQYWKGGTTVWGTCTAPMFEQLTRTKITVQTGLFNTDNEAVKATGGFQCHKQFGCIIFEQKPIK